MLSPMRTLLLIALITASVSAVATVYRWVDADGQVHFSDQPVTGAKKITLRESTIYSAPVLPETVTDTAVGGGGGEQKPFAYETLSVVNPEADQPIRSNEGQVNISIELQPGLQPGHKIRVYLDGTQAAEDLATTQISLQEVDRGTHSLEVGVIDESGKELKRSGAVSFHLLRVAAPRVGPFGGSG